jgi:hypothetical protein
LRGVGVFIATFRLGGVGVEINDGGGGLLIAPIPNSAFSFALRDERVIIRGVDSESSVSDGEEEGDNGKDG